MTITVWSLVVENDDIDITVHNTKDAAYAHLRRFWPVTAGDLVPDSEYWELLEEHYEASVYMNSHDIEVVL